MLKNLKQITVTPNIKNYFILKCECPKGLYVWSLQVTGDEKDKQK